MADREWAVTWLLGTMFTALGIASYLRTVASDFAGKGLLEGLLVAIAGIAALAAFFSAVFI